MGMQLFSAIVVGFLLGTDPGTPTEILANAQKDVPKVTVIVTDNATIKIAPGTKIKIGSVMTAQGTKLTLEMPGVMIELLRLRIEYEEDIVDIQIGQDGQLAVCRFPRER